MIKVRQFYDKFVGNYDKAFAPFEHRFLKRWCEKTLLHLPENARLLEIAAESGLKILTLKEKAFGIVNLIVCEVIK